MILVTSSVHHYLIKKKLRTFISLNVQSAECMDIHYFAVSNVETDTDLDEFLDLIPRNITIVPKIESPNGVKNIEKIIKKLDYEQRIVMLDHDDLFSNIKKENEDPSNFQKYIKLLIEKCKENNVNLLRTVGVVFSDDEKRETQYIK